MYDPVIQSPPCIYDTVFIIFVNGACDRIAFSRREYIIIDVDCCR